MDQIKIGKFIADRRKNVGLTQAQLAEKLGITDRAISKWENGRSMPDSSIMLDLCKTLKISVNDLLCREVVTVDNYNKELEQNLYEMVKEKERADKSALRLEILVGVLCIVFMIPLVMIASFVDMQEWLRVTLVLIGLVPLLIATPFMLRIEQTAGYYECPHCKNRYVPEYGKVFMAMHSGRTRYLKCPECEKRGWHKKRLSKED